MTRLHVDRSCRDCLYGRNRLEGGEEKCSLWAFASRLHRVFLFGCHKDDATLDAMLPPDHLRRHWCEPMMQVSTKIDSRRRKSVGRIFWRKAIKLAMMYPGESKYQCFLDGLLEIYRDGKRSASGWPLG